MAETKRDDGSPAAPVPTKAEREKMLDYCRRACGCRNAASAQNTYKFLCAFNAALEQVERERNAARGAIDNLLLERDGVNGLVAQRDVLQAELDKWRPPTDEEAEAAYAAAEAVPVSRERIEEIMRFVTDPANRLPNSDQATLVGALRRAWSRYDALTEAAGPLIEAVDTAEEECRVYSPSRQVGNREVVLVPVGDLRRLRAAAVRKEGV